MGLLASIGHNVRHLHDFSGRESRAQFWPWVIFLFILATIANLVLVFSMLADFMNRVFRFVQDNPDYDPGKVPFKPGTSPLPAELMPDMSWIMLPMQLINLAFVLLIAAAVWRRLHDRDRTGAWALAYLPFMAAGPLFGRRYIGAMTMMSPPDPLFVSLMMLFNLAGWLVLIFLIIQLASQGTTGPNRFGADPLALAQGQK